MSNESCAQQWLPNQICRDVSHASGVIRYLREQFDLNQSASTHVFVMGIELRSSGKLIGHVGLSPFEGEVEIGFGIKTEAQGQGYAIEAVSYYCRWGMEQFCLNRILGIADKNNLASQAVLQRCGFEVVEEKQTRFQGTVKEVLIYEIRNPERLESPPNSRMQIQFPCECEK